MPDKINKTESLSAEANELAGNIKELLDQVSTALFGRRRSEAIETDICVCCGKIATEFTDDVSKKEYSISGLCQKCQDFYFR